MGDALDIAVIGSGVSGLTAAHVLGRRHRVTLYERDERLGGHANTVAVRGEGGHEVGLDTGFIVHNERTYPTLLRLFADLGVRTQESDMSFSVRCEGCGLEYAGARGMQGVMPRASVLGRPRYLRMLAEVKRFHRHARAVLRDPAADRLTLEQFLADGGYSAYFTDHFMLPLTGAVWSSSPTTVRAYPARYLIRFFANHGMLTVTNSPQWKTVVGGSRVYVEAVANRLDRVLVSSPGRAHRANRRRRGRERRPALRPGRDRLPPRPGPRHARRPERRRAPPAGRLDVLAEPHRAPHRRLAAPARRRTPGRRGTTSSTRARRASRTCT